MVSEIIKHHGQVTIPEEIRQAAGIDEGDTVVFSVLGPGRVQMTTLRPMSVWEFIEKCPLNEEVAGRDWNEVREELENEQAAILLERVRRGEE